MRSAFEQRLQPPIVAVDARADDARAVTRRFDEPSAMNSKTSSAGRRTANSLVTSIKGRLLASLAWCGMPVLTEGWPRRA